MSTVELDPDRVVKTVLERGLGDDPTWNLADVRREIPPADRLADGDFVVFTELPGTSEWPGAVERVSYVLEAWVTTGAPTTRLTRVKQLGSAVRMVLQNQRWQRTPYGTLNFLTTAPRPTLTASGIDGVLRTTATYDFTIRP